ncbi:Metabotropic glutamate receptor 3 [Hypsibius exemplaris]|uniref:Metabotropic glutamate receptor 3 n=1 Tax=Hypsibius exemplaris TaxID=2072580 RepID=A0A9X6NGQ0_HYPEX|nr:Metabotropic glutamate receptor 3 [Hypsibius exemplaris]
MDHVGVVRVFSAAAFVWIVAAAIGGTTLESVNAGTTEDGGNKLVVYYPGDLLLGGLLPIHTEYNETTGVCTKIGELDGIIPTEAVLYLLDEINRAGILSFKLGFIAFDTCDSHSFTLEQALHFIHSHVQGEANSGKPSKDCKAKQGALSAGSTTDVFDVHKVVGLVTGLSSSVTISLAQLTRLFQLPQISFLSTSPLLSDKRRYDYFFRTVPSDVNQVRAIVEILKFYEWNHISIVYADDEYGNRALHELEQLSGTANLCFAAKLKIPVDTNPQNTFSKTYDQMVEKLVQAKTEVVILFSDVKFLGWFFNAIQRHRTRQATIEPSKRETNDFILIGSDAWGGREEYPEITEGLITVQLNTRELGQFAEHYINLVPSEAVCGRNPFYCKMWRECREKEERMKEPFRRRSSRGHRERRSLGGPCMLKDSFAGFAAETVSFLNIDNLRDAIYAYVYALKNMHVAKCGATHAGLCDAMRTVKGSELKLFLSNVSFEEPDGSIFRFHDGTDGQPRYTIMNMHRHSNQTDGSGQNRWVEVGKYTQDADLKSTLVLNKTATRYREDHPAYPVQTPCKPKCNPAANQVQSLRAETSCCWKCVKCEAWQYPNDQKCLDCPPGSVANFSAFLKYPIPPSSFSISVNICVPFQATFLDYTSLYAIPVLAFSAAGILASLLSAWVMLLHRDTPIVKAAGREHLSLLLLGVISSYAMNFVILWQPSSWSCIVVRLIGVCYAVCNSTVLIKIARIYRIFNTKESRKTQKLKYISPTSQIALTGGFVFVEFVIVAVWMAFDWPGVLQLHPNHLETELVCSDLHNLKLLSGLCYPLMLLFPMAYFAFRTRTCPAAFAEARHTGYGIYLTFINVLTFVLIFIGNNSVRIRVLTVCIGLCLNASVILVSTFFTKAYIILFRPHKNSKDCIMNSSRSLGKYANGGSATAADAGATQAVHCAACKALLSDALNGAVSLPRPRSNPDLTPQKDQKKFEGEKLLTRSRTCIYRNGHSIALSPTRHIL